MVFKKHMNLCVFPGLEGFVTVHTVILSSKQFSVHISLKSVNLAVVPL